MRILRIVISLIRGGCLRFGTLLSTKKSKIIGKGLRIYKNVQLTTRKNSRIRIGSNVKIDKDTSLSAVGNGEIILGDNVSIGSLNRVIAHERIEIGSDTMFAPNVMLFDHDHVIERGIGAKKTEYITSPICIGKNCWVGAGTIILRGTVIGDNCVVGAGCVLKGSYPSGSVIVQRRETKIR